MSGKMSKRALEHAIQQDKEELHRALSRLSECVKDEVDPRARVAKSPYRALGLSFAVGLVMGVMLAPRR
jgi:ElaB/YqjD/DUF883 family membrane-anchored ribosome-binding protein